jgi:large subunit ribosomal protein L6
MPVVIPPGLEVEIKGRYVRVKGPLGELAYTFPGDMQITLEDGQILVQRPTDAKAHRSMHGTTRAIIQNMVTGVSQGFVRELEVNGVGYRAEMDGAKLVLNVGYSHPVVVEPPEGIRFEADPRSRRIRVLGYDKQHVGQVAANIRKVRPPEPYKGKGIKYVEEYIRIKPGKSGKV